LKEEIDTENLNYKHLWLMNEVLPFMNQDGLEILEQRYSEFISIVKEKAYKADVTWQ